MEDRATFLAERRKGIGGSDCASLFNVGYGCKLRLARQKLGEIPDYVPQQSEAMELGAFLEPFFAEKYKRQTGRDIAVRNQPTVHPEHPELRVNVDRMINDVNDEARDVGVLEIKAVGREVFYRVKREGLPEDYILQLQHGMLVTGAEWGSFAVGSRDSGELLTWDVERDANICNLIIAEGVAFWRDLWAGIPPDRLDPDDRRCQKCEYRKSCQGAALIHITETKEALEQDETLRPLLNEYLERKMLLDQAEELVEETKEELKTTLGARTAVGVGESKIYYRPQVAMRGDFKQLAGFYEKLRQWALEIIGKHPELGPQNHRFVDEYESAEKFKTPVESRPLRIY